MCPTLLAELERVLLRPKFRPYVGAPEVRAYVALLQRLSSVESDPGVEAGLTPDSGDDYLVALARAAGAHFIVSGDPPPHRTQASHASCAHFKGFSPAAGILVFIDGMSPMPCNASALCPIWMLGMDALVIVVHQRPRGI